MFNFVLTPLLRTYLKPKTLSHRPPLKTGVKVGLLSLYVNTQRERFRLVADTST